MDLVCNVITVTHFHSNYMKIMRKIISLNSSQNTRKKLNKSKNTLKSFFFSACNCDSFEDFSGPKTKKFPIPG